MKQVIFQGLTTLTHASAVNELFRVPDFERAIVSVAFVSESGVDLVQENLELHASSLTVLAGVRNDITSYQGLSRLCSLGVKLYTVDTGSRLVLFHPKVFLVRGRQQARMVIGSANLTLGGLNNNIEAGVSLELDLTDPGDKAFVDEIESLLDSLPIDYPSHVMEVTDASILKQMLAGGRLTDEMALPPPRPTRAASGGGANDAIPRIKLMVPPLRRAPRQAPPPRQNTQLTEAIEDTDAAPTGELTTIGVEYELVWESKPLTRRDLTIPTHEGTHRTGSINLDKGLLEEVVDHRHYFREVVFTGLAWSPKSATVDEAFAKFHVVIKGISYGTYDLAIRHTHSTTTRSYEQRNAMTRLSWGPVAQYVAREDLIGRSLVLYRDEADPGMFVLEID